MVLSVFDISAVTSTEIYLAIFGYIVVFFVLVLLYLVFNNMPGLLKGGRKLAKWYQQLGKEQEADNGSGAEASTIPEELEISGEENAAISAAIYLYLNETHDEEDRVLTKKSVSKSYSPWSSKIYTVHNLR